MRQGCLLVLWVVFTMTATAADNPTTLWECEETKTNYAAFLSDGKSLFSVYKGKAFAWDLATFKRKSDLDGIENLEWPRVSSDGRWLTDVMTPGDRPAQNVTQT